MKTGAKMLFFTMAIWGLVAFLTILSPLSRMIAIDLPFRLLYLPVVYWISALLFLLFVRLQLPGDQRGAGSRAFVLNAIIFHLVSLMALFINNSTVVAKMYSAYLLYSYIAIFVVTVLCMMIPTIQYLRGDKIKALMGLPLIMVPILSLCLSAYSKSLKGVLIYGTLIFCYIIIIYINSRRSFLLSFAGSIKRFLNGIKSKGKTIALVIFLFAFFVRLLFSCVLIIKTGDDYILASDDGDSYDHIAFTIMKNPGDMLNTMAHASWPPVYLTFLGTIYMIFGRNFFIVNIFQAMLGAAIPVLIYLIGRRTFGQTTGIMAGVIAALSQPLIFMSSILGTEALYLPLVMYAIYVMMDALFFRCNRLYPKMVLSGVLFGLAAMTLYSITLFPIVVSGYILFFTKIEKSLRSRIKMAALFLASFLMVFVIIKLLCAMQTGSFKGVYEDAADIMWSMRTCYNYQLDPDNRKLIELGIVPFSAPIESIKNAVMNWREVLTISLQVYPIRFRNFLTWGNFGFFDPVFLANPTRLPTRFGAMLEFYTIAFFFLGLARSFKLERFREVLFILLFILYYMLLQSVFLCHTMRYSGPVKPFLMLFLSFGIYAGCKFFMKCSSASEDCRVLR